MIGVAGVDIRTMQRRLVLILSIYIFGIAALLGRLFYIQVWARHDLQGRDLVEASVSQRKESFVIDSGRGDILDRDGQSFTGSRIRGVLVMPLWKDETGSEKITQLAKILFALPNQVQQSLASIERPSLLRLPDATGKPQVVEVSEEQAKEIEKLSIPGIYAEAIKTRYDDNSLARHVIGFIGQDPELVSGMFQGKYPINEKVGKMGLEFLYQDELRGLGRAKEISYFTDAEKHPLNGLGMRISDEQNKALSVKTTLDMNVQKTVEQAMDKYRLQNGSVVLLDSKTEDILAMASRPQFDQNHPLSRNQFPVNKAVEADFPGSVFKTVIAAAALEKGVVQPNETFECPGYIEIGDGRLNCWTTHGTITAEQGFAESCNVVYATLAMRLGRQAIEEYAGTMGLGHSAAQKVNGKSQLYGEDVGRIFAKPETSLRLLANTGIGQEDVRVSPLQAASMIAAVANDGVQRKPRLVQELLTSEDKLLYKRFPLADKQQVLKRETAKELQRWMRETVASPKGTAYFLNDAKVKIAGKTGTAQTGHEQVHHHWFAGYAPADQPKYVIVVMAEDVATNEGSRLVQRIAKEIVNNLF